MNTLPVRDVCVHKYCGWLVGSGVGPQDSSKNPTFGVLGKTWFAKLCYYIHFRCYFEPTRKSNQPCLMRRAPEYSSLPIGSLMILWASRPRLA
jgi:hypothetical protein